MQTHNSCRTNTRVRKEHLRLRLSFLRRKKLIRLHRRRRQFTRQHENIRQTLRRLISQRRSYTLQIRHFKRARERTARRRPDDATLPPQ